jgi:hypothetical protein
LRFLDTLGEAGDRHGMVAHGYCLTPNHYHLLVQTLRGNLSQAVGWLQVTCMVRLVREPLQRQPLRRRRRPGICLVTAPAVLLEKAQPVGWHRITPVPWPHRVQIHVAQQLPRIVVGIDQARFEPPLREVATPAVPAVEWRPRPDEHWWRGGGSTGAISAAPSAK